MLHVSLLQDVISHLRKTDYLQIEDTMNVFQKSFTFFMIEYSSEMDVPS